jgi:hypothetical protein
MGKSMKATPNKESSQFRGVSRDETSKKWQARVAGVPGVEPYEGSFDSEEDAAMAVDKAAIERGLLDNLNFIYYPEGDMRADIRARQHRARQHEVIPCSEEPAGVLVGCQVTCFVEKHGGYFPGVLDDYFTEGDFKGHYKVRLRGMHGQTCYA